MYPVHNYHTPVEEPTNQPTNHTLYNIHFLLTFCLLLSLYTDCRFHSVSGSIAVVGDLYSQPTTKKKRMHDNRTFLKILGILLFRFAQSFRPTIAVADTTTSSITDNHFVSTPLLLSSRFSTTNRLSNIFSARNTRKMGIASTKEATDSVATETSTEEQQNAAVVVFSSSLLAPKDNNNNNNNNDEQQQPERTALIVLNYPIPSKSRLLDHLWKTSGTKIAADGGANRLYEYSKDYIPDRIRGDLDSLDPTVRAYYEGKDVSVEQDFCQDTNDLDKALQALVNYHDDDNRSSDSNISNTTNKTIFDRVVIYGAFGGRFDQEMAGFAALYKWAHRFGSQMYLYSDETFAFLVPSKTDCEIRLPFWGTKQQQQQQQDKDKGAATRTRIGEGPTCGLIPLGCRCDSVVTSGLEWDLDGSMPLEFGGLVSSSNRIMHPTVKVWSSHPLVFTAEVVSSTQ